MLRIIVSRAFIGHGLGHLTGWLRRYTAMVTSGSQGAVLAV